MTAETQSFAHVVVPSPLKEPLTYTVPSRLRQDISLGMRVLVPVGKRKLTGIVFDLTSKSSRAETKEIIALCDDRPILDRIERAHIADGAIMAHALFILALAGLLSYLDNIS